MVWEAEMVLRLLLAAFLGGIIGLERENLNKAAGLRTHTLVSVGSCLIMLVSISMYKQFNSEVNADPARLAAQVVSGIGFLGAGTIMRSGVNVKGLTTAATLWVVAGIGLAVGSGNYLAAALTTILVFILLVYFYKIEEFVGAKKRIYNLNITLTDRPGQIGLVCSALGNLEIEIKNVDLKEQNIEMVQVEILVKLPYHLSIEKVQHLLENIEGIHKIKLS
ncbi:MAG: MgtC/SapB family protein [Clostridia bacterium]|jgi:putative Mg2+ transporter-C (MgtC) family protein|nr:MgtC/SapB family protein [Clostridia bacterium]